MSHPEEMTKLGWTVHSSSRARVALRMDSGVPLQNSPGRIDVAHDQGGFGQIFQRQFHGNGVADVIDRKVQL